MEQLQNNNKLKLLFWFHSIAGLSFGLTFLVVPDFLSNLLAVPKISISGSAQAPIYIPGALGTSPSGN